MLTLGEVDSGNQEDSAKGNEKCDSFSKASSFG